MALRKALTYSKRYARPYTRVSRAKGKSYIKVVPPNKVVKYTVGNSKAFYDNKFTFVVTMVAAQPSQIRDNALEAARQFMTKVFDEKLPNNYYLEVKSQPHHILRNNKTAAGAGADRLSSGMRHSFGIVEGRAAIVKAGAPIFVAHCENDAAARIIREAMHMVKAKLPCGVRLLFEKKVVAQA